MNRPRLQVLVVDDEMSIRDLLRMTLEAEGYGVHEAATMREGLTLAGNRRIDLFLLDLGLPDGDGVTLVRQIRSWTRRPILVLSARTQESQKVDALDAGADDYVTKPFGVAELHARIRCGSRPPSGGCWRCWHVTPAASSPRASCCAKSGDPAMPSRRTTCESTCTSCARSWKKTRAGRLSC